MTISVLTHKEFKHLVYLPKQQLWQSLCNLPPREIMALRRQLQVSLTKYAKLCRSVDDVQLQAIGQIQWIENYCRRRYFKDMAKEVAQRYPNFSAAQVKERARDAWEKFCMKMSY